MGTDRTTLSADREDLELLRREAERRDISLSQVLRELVAAEADRLRSQRRPRFGIGRSKTGAAQAATAAEDEPMRARRGD